jgi:hypothetical protein
MWEPRRLTTRYLLPYLSKLDVEVVWENCIQNLCQFFFGCEMDSVNWNLCPGTRFCIIWDGIGYLRVSVARLMICWHLLPRRWHIANSVTNKAMCCWFFCRRDGWFFCQHRDDMLAALLPKRWCWWLCYQWDYIMAVMLPERWRDHGSVTTEMFALSTSIITKLYSNGIIVFLAILHNYLTLILMQCR